MGIGGKLKIVEGEGMGAIRGAAEVGGSKARGGILPFPSLWNICLLRPLHHRQGSPFVWKISKGANCCFTFFFSLHSFSRADIPYCHVPSSLFSPMVFVLEVEGEYYRHCLYSRRTKEVAMLERTETRRAPLSQSHEFHVSPRMGNRHRFRHFNRTCNRLKPIKTIINLKASGGKSIAKFGCRWIFVASTFTYCLAGMLARGGVSGSQKLKLLAGRGFLGGPGGAARNSLISISESSTNQKQVYAPAKLTISDNPIFYPSLQLFPQPFVGTNYSKLN